MLRVIKNGFPTVLMENDIKYLNYLYRIVENIDNEALIKIDKKDSYYHISVLPNNINIRPDLVEDIRVAHEAIGINIEFSKSLKISNYISWIIK